MDEAEKRLVTRRWRKAKERRDRGRKGEGWEKQTERQAAGGSFVGMAQQQAQGLGDVVGLMQRQALEAKQHEAQVPTLETPAEGFFIAPGVRFSERLWAKLGGKAHEADKQGRRERMTEATALPAPAFDKEFRRDSLWKQR